MEREKAVAAKLEAEYNMLTSEINILTQQNQRFSAEAAKLARERSQVTGQLGCFSTEAAKLARERSQVKLAWDRVLGRIRRMEAEQHE